MWVCAIPEILENSVLRNSARRFLSSWKVIKKKRSLQLCTLVHAAWIKTLGPFYVTGIKTAIVTHISHKLLQNYKQSRVKKNRIRWRHIYFCSCSCLLQCLVAVTKSPELLTAPGPSFILHKKFRGFLKMHLNGSKTGSFLKCILKIIHSPAFHCKLLYSLEGISFLDFRLISSIVSRLDSAATSDRYCHLLSINILPILPWPWSNFCALDLLTGGAQLTWWVSCISKMGWHAGCNLIF